MKYFYSVLIIILIISCNKNEEENTAQNSLDNKSLFTLLDSSGTGITFINKITDEENFNILTYRNFYNGGGVAIGDINNDSLPDIYFTANQKQNKLYLNKGNFKFEDITSKAGVGGTKIWSTGVTMADVNGDGYLDIYVSNSGDVDGTQRENELFINNGDLTFTERAAEYNLNNNGYGTHAAFFDYDLDGDLDCYILNNSFRDPGKIELYRKAREKPDAGGDKLMRNDGGTFKDVTTEAGIYSSEIGFGLGVAISDLNNDHLPDIYISNDFWERDYLYINQGKGKFSEELIDRINYCSISSMGADIADINNDGTPEIFTTDMLPADNWRLQTTMAFDPYHLEDAKYRANFHYQMVQNCLQLNNGDGQFQEIGLMAGVAATDWSWGALIFDFDNDGNKDIFVSNGILRDIMSMDFREFLADGEQRKIIVSKRGKFDYRDFISFIPSQPLKNYAFKNDGTLLFKDAATSLGLSQPSFSNGSSYADLDNDGDLDLVVNNINMQSFVYRNETNETSANHFLKVKFKGYAGNTYGIGAQVTINANGAIKTLQNYNTRGFESSIEPSLLFGLGTAVKIDELTVIWPDQKEQTIKNVSPNNVITLNYEEATFQVKPSATPEPQYEEVSRKYILGDASHHENRQNDFDQEILLPRMLSTEGPRLITGDVNSDQLDDFILLGAKGETDKLFMQKSDGTFSFKANISLQNDKDFESTCGALFDYDGDGDMDLIIGSGGNELGLDKKYFIIRQYLNDGKGVFSADPYGAPQALGNFSTVAVSDFDNDGDADIFFGARAVPGNYGLPPRSYLFKNDRGIWIDIAPPSLGNIGMVTDASWTDIDNDNDKDLVVVGDWMAIHSFKNNNGSFDQLTTVPSSNGWWNRIVPADLDGDGDIDFVVGNWGLNTKFKASVSKPVTMFVNDFDNNGKSEFIINWYPPLDTIAYPFATKMELTSQLPALKRSILRYKNYGHKTFDSLFTSTLKNQSLQYEVNLLQSSVLLNNGGELILQALPIEAQVSPVFGILVKDLDNDGIKDIWLGGNFYSMKPQVSRHDASRGVFLKGTGKGNFANVPIKQSGLIVQGEVRDVIQIKSLGHEKILIARNNGSVLFFQKK